MAKMPKNYGIEMTEGPLLSKMLAFTMPLMLSSVLQLLFSAVNVIVVGRFSGTEALAAVGSTGSLINLITNLFIGLSIGANVIAANCHGSREDAKMNRTVHTAMLLSLISGVVLTVVGILSARTFLVLMKTPEDVLDLATLYLRVYFLGITASMVYNFGSAILRAIGDTKRPLYYLLFAGVINLVLNLAFVILFKMGVAGVGLATAISQTVAAALVVICLMRSSGALHLDIRRLKIDRAIFLDILKIGLPAGVQGTLFSISNVIIQTSINTYGATIMAGNSAAASIESFVYVAMNSFYQASIAFASQNYGARRLDRVKKSLLYAQICVLVVGFLLGNLACLFGNALLGIYATGADVASVIAAGQERLNYVGRIYFLCGMMEVFVGTLRGIGHSILPMIVSLFGSTVLRILWVAYIAPLPVFGGIAGVYISYPVSWGFMLIGHALCYAWAIRRVKEKMDSQPQPA